MKAMILAAGMGTRLKPFTDKHPKALFEVGGRTLLEWAIRFLRRGGISELVINVHHFPDQIRDFLKMNQGFGCSYTISDESDLLMDTGGALVKVSGLLKSNGPFVLMGLDVLTDLDLCGMIRFHMKNRPLATLAVKDRSTSRSLLFNGDMRLTGWRDNRTGGIKGNSVFAHALGFSVIHIIDPEIFDLIEEKGPFSIIDLYLRVMGSHPIYGYRHDKDSWFEMGRTEMTETILKNPDFKKLLEKL